MKKFSILSIMLVCMFLSTPMKAEPQSTGRSLITYGLGAVGFGLARFGHNKILYILPYNAVTTPVIFMLPWCVLRVGEMLMQQQNNKS